MASFSSAVIAGAAGSAVAEGEVVDALGAGFLQPNDAMRAVRTSAATRRDAMRPA
jgi:hypothetical protein